MRPSMSFDSEKTFLTAQRAASHFGAAAALKPSSAHETKMQRREYGVYHSGSFPQEDLTAIAIDGNPKYFNLKSAASKLQGNAMEAVSGIA
jgi:hypothetical protein